MRSRLVRLSKEQSQEQAADGRHLVNNIGGEKSISDALSELNASLNRIWQEQNHCMYEMVQAVKNGDIDAYDALESKYSKIKENYEQKAKTAAGNRRILAEKFHKWYNFGRRK